MSVVVPIAPSYEPFAMSTYEAFITTHQSDSDGGYGTPVEHFADDEREQTRASDRPPVVVRQTGSLLVVDPELREKIVKQVEWYFSDDNLMKDSFLMKHINRNKLGYVSLKLVASLRKVKALAKDSEVVLASVRGSTLLALNEDETKIRRTTPAPQVDYTHVARTILITNYPQDEPNINSIENTFGKFGEVTLVRILHPGRAVPLDVKPCKADHPNLGTELCVLVEFESTAGAKVACQKFHDQQSWRDDMRVVLLDGKNTESPPSSPNANDKKKKRRQKTDKSTSDSSSVAAMQSSQTKARKHSKEVSPAPSRSMAESSPSPRHSRENSPMKQPYRKYSPPTMSSPEVQRRRKYSPDFSRRFLHPEAAKDYASDSGFTHDSPEVTKKVYEHSPLSWRSSEKHTHIRDGGVIRQPLGPNGSRGFGGDRKT